MDYDSFLRDAANKRRSVKDIARFISTRTDNNPNYSLLFGAGCSISSGVRSATELSTLWRKELYESCSDSTTNFNATHDEQRSYLKANEGSWYYPEREYSSLFEKRYDLQRQRRMFVESEVAGKTPSIGYAYLTSLVSENYFNTIFTTNFDDILNEAFYIYSDQRPIVCAHDSSINSITVTSKRPKIIKIHGDYLYDDLKSTVRETENLEQNIKSKFMEFAKDFGLIVVGYSGGDRSVMDVISSLLRNEEYLKNGIYWCIRPGSEISEELRKLIWRDRVYFVEIEGFDELFAELFHIFSNGQILPASATSIIHRPFDTTTKLLGNCATFPTTSPILKLAREKLERQSKRTNLVNLIVRPESDDKSRQFSSAGLEDDELVLLAEIQNLALSGDHQRVVEMGRSQLQQPLRKKLKLRILRTIADGYHALNQNREAIGIVDELIGMEPKNASHHLLKASFQIKTLGRLKCIEDAIAVNNYSVNAHLEKARYYSTKSSSLYGESRVEAVNIAHAAFDFGIQLNPTWTNRCWLEKFNLLESQELNKTIRQREQALIISQLEKQNPLSWCVLDMRQRILIDDIPIEKNNTLTSDIADARERSTPDIAYLFDLINIKLIAKSGDLEKLKTTLNVALYSEECSKDGDYAVEVAKILQEKFCRDNEAIDLLKKSLEHEFDSDVLFKLITSLVDANLCDEATLILNKWSKNLSPKLQQKLNLILLEGRDNIEEALIEINKNKLDSGIDYDFNEHYLLLRKEKFKEVEELLQKRLEKFNFTPEASVETVNYEFSRKKLGKKPNNDRLMNLIKQTPSDNRLSAGVYAVLGRKNELLAEIKKVMKDDKTFRFEAAKWPVFNEYSNDHDFKKVFEVS